MYRNIKMKEDEKITKQLIQEKTKNILEQNETEEGKIWVMKKP